MDLKPPVTKKSAYRHRGFRCNDCGIIKLVFGDSTLPPTTCCVMGYTLQWDHWVEETSVVTDYMVPQSGE